MIKGVKNLEGSWQFLKFMVSPEAQKIYPIEFGPQSSLLSLGSYWLDIQKSKLPQLSEAELQVMTEAPKLEQIDPENWTVNFSVINSQALQPALDKIWLGEETVEASIMEAAPKIRKLIDETKNIG
jgi:ABC-type glycerol-3-phosphate transport system substrate-binding protein